MHVIWAYVSTLNNEQIKLYVYVLVEYKRNKVANIGVAMFN